MIETKISEWAWNTKEYRYGDEPETGQGGTYNRMATTLFPENYEPYEEIFESHKALTAGRTTVGLGTGKDVSFSNCYVLPIGEDSFDGIFKAIRDEALTLKKGGGCGFNFSILRPRGAPIKSTKSVSKTGALGFLQIFNAVGAPIVGVGDRTQALMGVLNVSHPDILEFIGFKKDGGLSGFNLSVGITNDFMEAVVEDRDWDLRFPDINSEFYTKENWFGNLGKWESEGFPVKVYKTVKARELFDKIVKNSYEFAEPGVVFLDTINKSNVLQIQEYLQSTNPCLVGDTLILTDKGNVPIREIEEGDMVLTGEGVYKPVHKRLDNGIKPVYKLTLTNGQFIEVTKDHKIYTPDGKASVENLREGDKVCILHSTPNEIETEFSKNATYHGVMGWAVGDGWVENKKKISMCFGKDDDYAMNLIDSWLVENEYPHTEPKQKVNKKAWGEIPRYTSVGVKLFNEFAVDGYIQKGAGNKRVPYKIFTSTHNEIAEFLRGLFSADGHIINRIGKSVEARLTSKSIGLLEDVQNLLFRFGIQSKIYDRGRVRDGELRQCYDLCINGESLRLFKKYIGFKYSPKKDAILSEIPETVNNYGKNKQYCCIKSIEPLYEEEVYDLMVYDIHSYYANGVLVSNCGEAILPKFGSCNLASINIVQHIIHPFGDDVCVDYDGIYQTVELMVDVLDKVVTLGADKHPLKEQSDEVKNKRPIGLGFTGLGSALAMLKVIYGSKKSIEITEKIIKTIRDSAYKRSIQLAKEYGAFPAFNLDEYKMSSLWDGLPDDIKVGIETYGIRNSRILSVAPTGTMSLFMNNVSGGIEPIFDLEYYKNLRILNSNDKEKVEVQDYAWAKYKELNPDVTIETKPAFFVTTEDIPVDAHIEIQAVVQKYVDQSISKTVNVPSDYPYEDYKDIYLKAWKKGIKGMTVYRPNSVVGQVLERKSEQKGTNVVDTQMKDERIAINHVVPYMNNSKLYVTTSIDNMGNPLEVITKVPKPAAVISGKYDPILHHKEMSNWDLICRLSSLCMRYGVPLEKIIEQMDDSSYNMYDLSAILSRILKKYPRDVITKDNGYKKSKILFDCPKCGKKTLKKDGGCSECISEDCNYTAGCG